MERYDSSGKAKFYYFIKNLELYFSVKRCVISQFFVTLRNTEKTLRTTEQISLKNICN